MSSEESSNEVSGDTVRPHPWTGAKPKSKKGKPFPTRNTAETRQLANERRNKVREFMVRDLSETAIARILGVSVHTISSDIKKISGEIEGRFKQRRVLQEVAEACEYFDKISSSALVAAAAHEKPTDKNNFWNTALRAKSMKLDLLMKTGILPSDVSKKRQDEVAPGKSIVTSDVHQVMQDPASRSKVLSIFSRLMKVGGKEISKDILSKEPTNGQIIDIPPIHKPEDDASGSSVD